MSLNVLCGASLSTRGDPHPQQHRMQAPRSMPLLPSHKTGTRLASPERPVHTQVHHGRPLAVTASAAVLQSLHTADSQKTLQELQPIVNRMGIDMRMGLDLGGVRNPAPGHQ